MKKIGIVGGVSHYTTIEYYARLMDLYRKEYNDLNYPEIVIYSLSHGKFKQYEDFHLIDKYTDYISEAINGLINSGAEIIALAANSPHRVINELQGRFDIPIISAVDSAFFEAKRLDIKKGLLLGIKFAMQSSFYQERFNKGSIELIVPNIEDQDIVNDVISNKLKNSKNIDPTSIESILNVISRYPVDGVILGCMRLPVFFNSNTVDDLKLVNTLDKHIEEILKNAK